MQTRVNRKHDSYYYAHTFVILSYFVVLPSHNKYFHNKTRVRIKRNNLKNTANDGKHLTICWKSVDYYSFLNCNG